MTRVSRSRFGCHTCRVRKVKCDEARPSCHQCLRTGRKCEGLSLIIKHHQVRSRAAAPPFLALNPHTFPYLRCQHQTRSFDFYLHHAGPSLAGSLDGELWQSILPQLSQHSETIRLALLTVSKLFEHPLAGSWDNAAFTYDDGQQRAMAWYSESISRALRSSETCDEDAEVQLVSCLLFTCVEVQQINAPNAMKLLEVGYRLISKYTSLKSQRHQSVPGWIISQVYPLFLRQTMLFWMLGHPLPPQWHTVVAQLLKSLEEPMQSLSDARTQLYALLYRTMELAEQAKDKDQRTIQMLAAQYRDLLSRLEQWKKYMTEAIQEYSLSTRERSTYHTLICGHEVAYAWVTMFFDPNYADAERQSICETILTHAEEVLRLNDSHSGRTRVPYSFEMGVIPLLHFAGEHCQSAHLRRRAIDLLRRAPLQESLFEAHLQIRGLEKQSEFEEQALENSAHTTASVETETARSPVPIDVAQPSPGFSQPHPALLLAPTAFRAPWGCYFSTGAYTDDRV